MVYCLRGEGARARGREGEGERSLVQQRAYLHDACALRQDRRTCWSSQARSQRQGGAWALHGAVCVLLNAVGRMPRLKEDLACCRT